MNGSDSVNDGHGTRGDRARWRGRGAEREATRDTGTAGQFDIIRLRTGNSVQAGTQVVADLNSLF